MKDYTKSVNDYIKELDKDKRYYNIDNIIKLNCVHNVIYGQRSNGKTFQALVKVALKNYLLYGKKFGYIRRYKDNARATQVKKLFNGIDIDKMTAGEYQAVDYYNGEFYLSKVEGHTLTRVEPIGYLFYVTEQENYKSFSYLDVKNIIFDEFISNVGYGETEFKDFNNLLSTIIRTREDFESIYYLGNTLSKFCIYFKEWNLKNLGKQKQGSIDVYTYQNGTTLACEYCKEIEDKKQKKTINKYFGFDNPKLQVITNGAWDLEIYPHLVEKYRPADVLDNIYFSFNENIYKCDLVVKDSGYYFGYIHEFNKVSFKGLFDSYIVGDIDTYISSPYHIKNIKRSDLKVLKLFMRFYNENKIQYQNNEVGDNIFNYMLNC